MSWCPTGMRIGFLDNTLSDYVLALSMILLNPVPSNARFSEIKFSMIESKMKRPVAPITGSKILILYFSWCSFQHFKKLRHVSAALPTRGKAAERSLECAQRLMIITQFLVKLWRTIFSWDRMTWFCLSSRERGWEYSNSSFIKNVDERRVKRLSFYEFTF
mgnify:CR=1 FL=1